MVACLFSVVMAVVVTWWWYGGGDALVVFVWKQDLLCLNWPWTHCIVENDLELLILLFPPPKHYDDRCVPSQPILHSTRNQPQRCVHFNEALYQRSHMSRPGPPRCEKSWPHAPCHELATATETVSQILPSSFELLLANILSEQPEK